MVDEAKDVAGDIAEDSGLGEEVARSFQFFFDLMCRPRKGFLRDVMSMVAGSGAFSGLECLENSASKFK